MLGIEEQFAHMGVAGVGHKQDEGFVVIYSPSPPPVPTTLSASVVGVLISYAVVVGEYQNQVFSDGDKCDQWRSRKQTRWMKGGGGAFGLEMWSRVMAFWVFSLAAYCLLLSST